MSWTSIFHTLEVLQMDVDDEKFESSNDSIDAVLSAVLEGIADIEAGRSQDVEEFFEELADRYES